MKAHPRIPKFFKWGGLVVSVVLLTVWVGTAYGRAIWWTHSTGQLEMTKGKFFLLQILDGQQPQSMGLHIVKHDPPGFLWSFHYYKTYRLREVGIPLWPFMLISIAATATAWRMDTLAQRRNRQGKCKACGYDLAGLAVGAPCPECNAKA